MTPEQFRALADKFERSDEQGFYEGMKYCRDLIQKWDQR